MKALELSALAIFCSFSQRTPDEPRRETAAPSLRPVAPDPAASHQDTPQAPMQDPLAFIREESDPSAQYFRARDDAVEIFVAFLSDGRVRLADGGDYRFAGVLQGEKSDLLEIGSGQWSRLFVHAAPDGKRQLEIYGGPYDARVLICEAFTE
jgi:hypothetical protein